MDRTSLAPLEVEFDVRLLKWPPFEVFLVPATFHLPSPALLAARLLFATLQTLRFTSHAACTQTHRQRQGCLSSRLSLQQRPWCFCTISTLGLLRLIGIRRSASAIALRSRRLLFLFRTWLSHILGGRWRGGRRVSGDERRRGELDLRSHTGYAQALVASLSLLRNRVCDRNGNGPFLLGSRRRAGLSSSVPCVLRY